MKRRIISTLFILAVTAAASAPASALEMTGGVIESKRYPLGGKHEFFLNYTALLGSNFTESNMLGLQYMYHAIEYLGIGVDAAYGVAAGESGTMKRIRRSENDPEAAGAIGTLRKFPIDLDRRVIQWFAGGVIHWYPIYGRWSVAGSFDLSWDIYIQGGGYAIGAKTYSAFLQTDENNNYMDSPDAPNQTGVKGAANFGVGMRFHIWDYIALRLEYKGMVMFDKGVQYLSEDARKQKLEDPAAWQQYYDQAKESGDKEMYKSKTALLNFLSVGINVLF